MTSTRIREVIGREGLTGCPTSSRQGSGPRLYYLDQALFHMSTHLLLAPSQWGAAQRTYLAPFLRLPPLHLPYTGWKSTEREKEGTWFKLSKLPRMFLRITSLFWGEISGILCQMILNKPDQYDSSLQANRSFKGSLCVCHVLICDTLNLLPTHYSYETCFHPFASFLFLPFPPVPSPPTPLPHTHI